MARKHDTQTVEQGLSALARARGNSRKARVLLAAEGVKVDHSTLHRWKQQHAAHYSQLAQRGRS